MMAGVQPFYLPDGPYESREDMRLALERAAASQDPLFFALVHQPSELAS